MHAVFPVESMAGAFEIVCYFFTVVAALASCLFSLRF